VLSALFESLWSVRFFNGFKCFFNAQQGCIYLIHDTDLIHSNGNALKYHYN